MSGIAASKELLNGRISKLAARIVTIVIFVLAMCTVLGRLVFLLVQRKKLRLDDVLLTLATIFMIAGTITLLYGLDDIYDVETLALNGLAVGDGRNWLGNLDRYMAINWSHAVLTWLSIFLVKFSFLAFFRDLCSRLPNIELYRKIVVGLCVAIFVYTILHPFMLCPKSGIAVLECATPAMKRTAVAVNATVLVLDVLTDILILVIPVILLWRVKLETRQKIGIGIFLCLSMVMIMIAIVRAAGMQYYDTVDNSWMSLWQQLEASAAVTMIALTAFRSIFVQPQHRKYNHRPWVASIPRIFKKRRDSLMDSQVMPLNDVPIPQAHLTGVRTFISRGDTSSEHSNRSHEPVRETGHLLSHQMAILTKTSHVIEQQPRCLLSG